MENNKVCPVCGCKEIGRGKQFAQGSMYPIDTAFSNGPKIISDICTKCGYILSMKVEKSERFK